MPSTSSSPGRPTTASSRGSGPPFATHLRGHEERFAQIVTCLTRHGLPCLPDDVGLSDEQFVTAVLAAPQTRPDRYTILEHLALDRDQTTARVAAFVAAVREVRTAA